jgi:hypothetical protein
LSEEVISEEEAVYICLIHLLSETQIFR